MRLWHVSDSFLKLHPATTKCADDLRFFRDAVAQETGFFWSDHDSYIFHMTYAYRLIKLTTEEYQSKQALMRAQAERFRKKFPEFMLPAGVFCTFRDMTRFEPYPLKTYHD